MIRAAVLVIAALALSTALASAAPPPRTATTGANALLVQITIPGEGSVVLGDLEWPANVSADVQSFTYPDDGSILRMGRSRASISAYPGAAATSQAFSEVLVLSVFNGEITAAQVTATTRSGAGERSTEAVTGGSAVLGLRALEQSVPSRPGTVGLSDWGSLTVLSEDTGTAAAAPPRAQASVVALRIRLTADHGGLPAGSEIVVGTAETTAVAKLSERPGGGRPAPAPEPTQPSLPTAPEPDDPGEAVPGGPVRVPPEVTAPLSAGGYVFPIYGPVSFGDSFGAPRAGIPGGWHHGEDIFAPAGAPVLAVADGTIHTVGFIKLGGYRLWLRDDSGNEFYYAHLSAYTPLAIEGRRVEAGDVIGFVGDTGDAEGGLPHLHFEIHPAAMVGLGYDGVVAPYPILVAWRRADDISFSAGRVFVPTTGTGVEELPPPGAVLLQADDISPTSGLVPGGLESALGG